MIAQKSSLLALLVALSFLLFCTQRLPAQLPTLDWALHTGSTSTDQGDALVIDAQGNAYAAGYHQGAADLDPGAGVVATTGAGMYIQKFDPQGLLIWAVDIAGAGSFNFYDLALDANGNLVAVGTFAGTMDFDPGAGTSYLTAQGGRDVFVLKLSAAGTFLFAKVAVTGTGVDEVPRSVGIDPQGNIVVGGWFTADADFDPSPATAVRYSAGSLDAFVAKYDSSGNLVWVQNLGNTSVDAVLDMTIDATGNITAVGKFAATVDFDPGVATVNLTAAGNFDGFIIRLDPNGNLVWARPFTTSQGNNCAPNSITTDATGNMIVAGSFFGAVDLDPGAGLANTLTTGLADMFVLKLDAAGNYLWSWGFGGGYQDGLYDVSTDAIGDIYVASVYEGTVDFDPGPGVTSATAITYKDIAVVKFGAGGAFGWAALAGGAQNDFMKQLRVSPQNDLYVTGSFIFSADFDPSPATYSLTTVGAADAFLYRLDLCSSPLQSTITDTTCGNYELNGMVYGSSGTYTQVLTGTLGCDSIITLNLTVLPLVVGIQVTANMLTASPSGGTYQWLDCANGNAAIPGATGQVFAPAASGSFAVLVSMQGCSDTSSCTALTVVGVPAVEDTQVRLAPNPASTQLRLSADIALGDVRIVNMLGQVVWRHEGILEHAILLDVSSWARGVYSVHLDLGRRQLFLVQ